MDVCLESGVIVMFNIFSFVVTRIDLDGHDNNNNNNENEKRSHDPDDCCVLLLTRRMMMNSKFNMFLPVHHQTTQQGKE